MKVFKTIFLCFLIPFALVGCAATNPLTKSVSELRSDIYCGTGEHYSLSACYGFIESPFDNDAIVGTRKYFLRFKLNDKQLTQAAHTVSLNYENKNYSADFKLNPVTHTNIAEIIIEGFKLKEFEVSVSSGGVSEVITMRSILPENTISYTAALDFLYKHQRHLVDSFINKEGEFKAEIYVRVIVKENHSYYYVGIASGNGNLKALLIDGFTGEVLAIREIF